MATGSIRGLFVSPAAKALVKESLEAVPIADQAKVRDVFVKAAGSDAAVRHLSLDEAQLVKAALDGAKSPAGGFDLAKLTTTVTGRVAERLKASNPDGIRTYFTSTTPNISAKVIEAMTETIARAKGKRVDIDLMVFAFTEVKIADAILELAESNPNAHFHLITDFGQLTTSGGRQPSRMEDLAKKKKLENIQVKYKKDSPYIWSDSLSRPVYNHSSSKGLNHHKGLITRIEGKVDTLVTGSFNWSPTAANDNFENLFVVSAKNPANRPMMEDFAREAVAFFNHPDSLNRAQAKAHKAKIWSDLRVAHGLPPLAVPASVAATPVYAPPIASSSFDLNQLSDENHERLKSSIGDSKLVRSIEHQIATYGAFVDFSNLLERVPVLSKLPESKRAALEAVFEFGTGRVALNSANANELMKSLKISKTSALAIVAKRAELGDFESVEQIRGLPGINDGVFSRIAPRLDEVSARAYFSSRGFADAAAGTGYDSTNAARLVPVMGKDGVVGAQPAKLSAASVDLMRRAKPGDVVKLALYGLSANTPDYAELVDAATRGVGFKVVLNDDFNEGIAKSLATLGQNGLPIEVRILKSKTMHEKFGVLNDDFFQGSANSSGSASDKNSEDRFQLKNNVEEAEAYHAEHALLWDKAKPVIV
ncbi:MAG: helix-hairpin-helix domain-containing protein [Deltaproteobacteria bacterium]|nr:helix-hairpin-helix domain-containing protein [Deltaproteobacteria bacterium]